MVVDPIVVSLYVFFCFSMRIYYYIRKMDYLFMFCLRLGTGKL